MKCGRRRFDQNAGERSSCRRRRRRARWQSTYHQAAKSCRSAGARAAACGDRNPYRRPSSAGDRRGWWHRGGGGVACNWRETASAAVNGGLSIMQRTASKISLAIIIAAETKKAGKNKHGIDIKSKASYGIAARAAASYMRCCCVRA